MVSIKHYLSLIKFSHTIFAMPFAIIGFTIAFQQQTIACASPILKILKLPCSPTTTYYLAVLILVVLAMVFARTAAMAFNRYIDRNIDALNPRTAVREIPQGIISPKNAAVFTVLNSLLFVIVSYLLNPLCFWLSPIALFTILFYSYTKRFTALAHIVLGLGLSLAPIGAYIAVAGKFEWLPILFSFLVLTWVAGFDVIYSLQDENFDKSLKLKSIPVKFGAAKALHISELLHLITAALVIIIYFYPAFGWLYIIGGSIFILMLIYQHSLVKANDLSKVNIAFMTANGIASIVYAAFVIADLLL